MAVPKRHCMLTLSLSITVTIVAAITFWQLPGNSLLWRELQNTGHTPLFGCLALAILFILRESFPPVRGNPLLAYPLAGIASLALGIFIELGQLLTHRDPSVSDVLRDLAGIIAALSIYAGIDSRLVSVWHRQHKGLRAGTIALGCCLFLGGLVPLGQQIMVSLQRDSAFPVIIDPGADWSGAFLQFDHATLALVPAPERWTSVSGQHVARLVLKPARYPGIAVIEPYPDWSAFANLRFTLYSSETRPFDLVLRIHDQLHDQAYSDRFNLELRVMPGENVFRIPLASIQYAPADRSMDLKRIAGLMLFAIDITSPVEFYLDTMRLENYPATAEGVPDQAE